MKTSLFLRAGFALLLSTSLLTACETNDVVPNTESSSSTSSAKSSGTSTSKGGCKKAPTDTTSTSTSSPT